MQKPRLPLNSWMPRIPNTIRNKSTINKTFRSAGILFSKELTTVLMPSFLLTTLNGLKALRARKPLMKEISVLITDSRMIVKIEKKTIIKSS